MCGIVAIVSRPSSRPTPSADEIVALLDRAVAAATLTDAAAAGGRGRPRAAWRAGHAGAGRPQRTDRRHHRPPRPDRWSHCRARARARRGPHAVARRDRSGQRRAARRARRGVGGPQGPPAHGRRRGRLRRSRRWASRRWPATWPSSRRSRRSTAWRCAAATAPASTCSCGTTDSTWPTRRLPPRIVQRGLDPLFQSGSVRVAGDRLASSTRPPPRSASWATT